MPSPRLQDAPLVGRGFTSDVYGWGERRVLKLFHRRYDPGRADVEYRVARAVWQAGLPAPAAYELVEVGGRRGVVFERVEGPSLFACVQARPWTLFRAVRLLAELHARVHRCTAPAELGSQRARLAADIDAATGLSAADRDAARATLAGLPDGAALCHGDFHPANVLMTRRGPVVIDWGAATRGDPMGDLACTSHLLRHAGLPPWAPRSMHVLLTCSRALLHRRYLKRSLELHGATRREVDAWRVPVAAAMTRRGSYAPRQGDPGSSS